MRIYDRIGKAIIFISALVLCFSSCTKKPALSRTATGLEYTMIESKGGKKPAIGDILDMHMVYKSQKDSLLYDSKIIGDSFLIQLSTPSFIGSMEEGFAMMGEGDSAVFIVSADSVYQKLFKQSRPAEIASGEKLKFYIRLKKVYTQSEFKEISTKKQSDWDRKEDLQIIDFLKKNNNVVSPVADGVYFLVFEEGKGPKPEIGDSIQVKYTGKFLDGAIFDDSEKAGSDLRYRLGDKSRIPVWDQALSSVKEGSFFRLILASRRAFRNKQYGPVPPNSTVIYDIHLVKVFPKKQGT